MAYEFENVPLRLKKAARWAVAAVAGAALIGQLAGVPAWAGFSIPGFESEKCEKCVQKADEKAESQEEFCERLQEKCAKKCEGDRAFEFISEEVCGEGDIEE